MLVDLQTMLSGARVAMQPFNPSLRDTLCAQTIIGLHDADALRPDSNVPEVLRMWYGNLPRNNARFLLWNALRNSIVMGRG